MKTLLSKIILSLLFCYVLTCHAQIKVHDGGTVSIGGQITSPSAPSSPVSNFYVNGLSNNWSTTTLRSNNFNPWAHNLIIESPLISGNQTAIDVRHINGATNFYLTTDGWMLSQGMYVGSDSTLKRNINKLSPAALGKIIQLNGYIYNYKPTLIKKGEDSSKYFKTDTSLRSGIMAQEVQRVYPYAVREMKNGLLAVDYNQLIPLLIEGIKELNVELNKEKDANKLLNARFNKLLSELDTTGGKALLKETEKSNVFLLAQNKPNPFSTETEIGYDLQSNYSSASIYIFDLQGGLKKSYNLTNSKGSIKIKSNDLTAGMYLYTLVVDGNQVDTKRMILTN